MKKFCLFFAIYDYRLCHTIASNPENLDIRQLLISQKMKIEFWKFHRFCVNCSNANFFKEKSLPNLICCVEYLKEKECFRIKCALHNHHNRGVSPIFSQYGCPRSLVYMGIVNLRLLRHT